MNNYFKHKDEDSIKKRKKVGWTILLLILFFVFEYICIFHGTRFRPYSVITMLGAWIIVVVLWGMWTNQEQLLNSTDFLTRGKYLLISSLKLLLAIVPVIYLTSESIDYVQEYQLKQYGILTKGEITNVTVNTDSNDTTYHADFTFLVKDQATYGFSVINKNEYEIGDSVFILYSSDDINLQRLNGKMNL